MRDDRSPSARSSLGGVRTDLAKLRDRLTEWLVDKAFPLWWEVGADRQRGGYHERIGLDGIPILEPRRARVQPRQIYCFSVAHDLAWP
ncbi:MAG: AGE family epimerase/isomerase, partial [Hyphomicrobiales bacterium]|nr:AGE family epimerase/isomerase [Hyphomicrobiales bacterium]